MTWTPTEWGVAASGVFASYYGARLVFMFLCGMFGMGKVHTFEVTIIKKEE